MLRKLLTLMAVITGLAAQAAPAQAMESAHNAVALERGLEQVSACDAAAYGLAIAPALRAVASKSAEGGFCPRPSLTIVVPTVYLGPDRAHE